MVAIPDPIPTDAQVLVDEYSRADLNDIATQLDIVDPEGMANKLEVATAIVNTTYAPEETVAPIPKPIPTKEELLEMEDEPLKDAAKVFGLTPGDYADNDAMADAILEVYKRRYPFVWQQMEYQRKKDAGEIPPRDEMWRDWPKVLKPQPIPGKHHSMCKTCVNSCKQRFFVQKCGQYREADGLIHG